MNIKLFYDVDGVILDYDTAFWNWMYQNQIHSFESTYFPNFWDAEHIEIDFRKHSTDFVYSNALKNLNPLIPIDQFNQLSSQFHTHLVTNIPTSSLEYRLHNLNEVKLKFHEITLAGPETYQEKGRLNKKSDVIKKYCNEETIAIFLDDLEVNCLDVKNSCPDKHVIMMGTAHNKNFHHPSIPRVDNWDEFMQEISPILNI